MKYYRNPNQSQLWPGEIWRNQGIGSVAANNVDFIFEVCEAFRRLAATGGQFTINEVRSLVTTIPTHHNAWGASCHIAQQQRICHQVGGEKSRRPQARARRIPLYRGNR